jgi:hypothetical protein
METAHAPMPMPRSPLFIFGDREYQLSKATISAAVGDPYWCDTYNHGKGKSISWLISFESETDDDDLSPPSVEINGIQPDVTNWHDLPGYETRWVEAINSETGKRCGLTYVHDHLLISIGRVQILNREGTKFRVWASGENEDGQRFTIDASAEFKGIYVRGSQTDSDKTIRARLNEHIGDANLVSTPFKLDGKYQSGVMAGSSFYSPATE